MDPNPCIPQLKALADETRWRIVRELLTSPLTVTQITDKLKAPQYNISKHLRVLREAGIVTTQRHGKQVECAVSPLFRSRWKKDQSTLDLGCCTFRFDRLPA